MASRSQRNLLGIDRIGERMGIIVLALAGGLSIGAGVLALVVAVAGVSDNNAIWAFALSLLGFGLLCGGAGYLWYRRFERPARTD